MNTFQIAPVVFGKFLEATISASVLAAIILLLQLALRKRLNAAWRFALWTPVLIRLLIPVLPESSFSIFNAPRWFRSLAPSKPRITVEIRNAAPAFPIISQKMELPIVAPQYIPQVKGATLSTFKKLTLLWLVVSGFLGLRLVIGALWLNLRLRKNRRLPSPFLLRIFLSACHETRTAWKPRMIETKLIDSPGLFGFLRPTLLLPHRIDSQLTETELRHIFLHELAHLKRGDLISNWFMSLAHALHWFNPIVWLVLRRLRLERELACDALALRFTESEGPRPYGETILKLLDRAKPRVPLPAMVGILEEKRTAKSRLEQITTYSRRTGFQKIGIFLLVCIAILGLSNAQTKGRVEGPSPASQDLPSPTHLRHDDDLSIRGIAALEAEYAKQKKFVEEAQKNVDGLKSTLGIEEFLGSPPNETLRCCGSSTDDPREEIKRFESEHVRLNELLQQFKGKSREELRKVMPVAYPNSELNRLLTTFHQTEQQRAALLSDFDKSQPDVQRLDQILKKIDEQIDQQIDVTLLGLEVKTQEAKAIAGRLKKNAEQARRENTEKRARYEPYFTAKNNLENQQRILDTIYMRLLAEKVDAKLAENNALIQDARLLMEMSKLDEAEAKLKAALKNDPDSRVAKHYLSQINETRNTSQIQEKRIVSPTIKIGMVEAKLDSSELPDISAPLYTRTFKVDPAIFLENLERLQGPKPATNVDPTIATNRIQTLVRTYFRSKGVDFRTNVVALADGQPVTPQKAIFFNDRTGVLFVRANLADLDKIEKALQMFNTKSHEVEFYCRLISLPPEAGAEFITDFIKKPFNKPAYSPNAVTTVTTVMNDDQIKQTVEALKQGSNTVSISNRTVTITGLLSDPQFSNVVSAIGGTTNQNPEGPDATHVYKTENDLMDAAEKIKGSQVLGGVSLLAFTGQTAVIKVAAGPKMEVTGRYDSENKLHQFRADVTIPASSETLTFSAYGAVHQGEAFVFAKKARLSEEKGVPVLSDIPGVGPLFRNPSPGERMILFFILPKAREPQSRDGEK